MKACVVCGQPGVLYPGGLRCPEHTPAKAMGLPEPQTAAERKATRAGRALRDEGMAKVEAASDDWQREAIDRAIRECADRGPFSANTVRPMLPEGVRPPLIGARFLAASKAGFIRSVGYTTSTDPGTRSHPVALWERVA